MPGTPSRPRRGIALAPHERLPEILVVPREKTPTGAALKLKLQYFGHLMQRADSFEKTLMLGKIAQVLQYST